MNYLDVYKRRISHLGTTPQDRAYSSGILEFRRYLKYNQHTERELILERDNLKFDGVILTDKEDENRISQILLTKVIEDGGPALKPGDLVLWNDEHWILYRSTTSSYQPHQKFYMVRCNYYIKWIDAEGMVQGSWIYLLGSKDSKIKDNFRTWHSVITPQPNKYINIIMPHQLMPLGTEIMVLDEVWYLVDYDQNSVPGVIFMSFTETNFNEQRDSLEDKLANADKEAVWSISMADSRIVKPNETITLDYALFKNGVVKQVEPQISVDGNLTYLGNNQVLVGASGGGTITVSYGGANKAQTIAVGNSPTIKPILIGDDKIRVASTNTYTLQNAEPDKVTFALDDPEQLVTLRAEGNICTIIVNDKNKLGSFKLKVSYEGHAPLEKEISVVSLWQVI